ncbi:MAG TPA: MmgE/PrpD family protein [Candidatus Eisenbacteria bacterium]|nr:MmgE/PrpD family protein [Candidatus Eisenbacteria bacterium]
MSTLPPVTGILARFVAETDYSNFSEKARENGKLHILDTLGAALAAVSTPTATIAFDYCKAWGGAPEAAVWGTRNRFPAALAAFANGLLGHALDYDDWDAFVHAGHPTSIVAAAAIALGEAKGSTGTEVLASYILGIEVLTRLAGGGPNLQARGFHSTPVLGSLGAAATCARLLRLAPEKVAAALGIAASAASGIQRQQGTMVKPFHAGNAARSGIEAALLAERGFTADPAILEAPRGFCDTFFGAGAWDADKIIGGLGNPWFLESPGLGFKLHPCSAPQFLAADAALHLKRQHNIDFAQVEKVTVSVPPLRHQRHYHAEVKTGLRGKFAVNYVVALCMLDGRLELETFSDERVNAPDAQDALRRVEVIADATIPEPGPYCPVTVELRSGGRLSYTATVPKGHPDNPLTVDEVTGKFRSNARLAFSAERIERVAHTVLNLETVADARELAQLLAAA